MENYLTEQEKNALNQVADNLFFSNNNYELIWMNEYARKLIQNVGALFGIKDPDEMLGMKIDQFHRDPNYQRNLLDQVEFPYETVIDGPKGKKVKLVITEYKNISNEKQGYCLIWHNL